MVKQSAALCLLHLYQHSKIYFCQSVVSFVTELLKNPSSLWIVQILQILVLVTPLTQLPDEVMQELMNLLRAVLNAKNGKVISLVYNIFEKAVDTVDIMA